MNPLGFLDVARHIAGRNAAPDEESRSRTIVGRAYYALFNVVAGEFEKIGTKLPADASGHKKAAQYLLNTKIPEARQLGKALDTLRDERNDADYRMGAKGFDLAAADQAIARTEGALKMLDAIDKTFLKAQVDHYRRTVDKSLPT